MLAPHRWVPPRRAEVRVVEPAGVQVEVQVAERVELRDAEERLYAEVEHRLSSCSPR